MTGKEERSRPGYGEKMRWPLKLLLDIPFDGVVNSPLVIQQPSQQKHQADGGTTDTMSENRDTVRHHALATGASGAQMRRVSLELMASSALLPPLPSRSRSRFPDR